MSTKPNTDDLAPPFDKAPGQTVYFGVDGDPVKGTVKDVVRGVPADEYPDEGEVVTFKSVGGEVEKTVAEVNPSDEYPIVLGHGGKYRRSNFVEYTVEETYRIIELADGREIWPQMDESASDGGNDNGD